MRPYRSDLRSDQNAFTLVELLAAIAVFSLLMVVVFGAYNHIARVWTATERRTETFQNVRLVLDMMARELEGAVAFSNVNTGRKITFLSYANENTLPVSPAPSQLGQIATPNDQLFFVAADPTSAESGNPDLAEFGYFVVYAKEDFHTMRGKRYYLIRHYAPASSSHFDVFTQPLTWDQTPGFTTSTKTPVLDNVLRLEFRFQGLDTDSSSGQAVTNGTQIVEQWNNNPCPGASPSQPCTVGCARPIDLNPQVTQPEVQLPRAVHVRFAMIDRRTAARLEGYMSAQGWNDGIPESRLRQVIPNCAGEDLTTLASTDAVLANILRDNVYVFYRTIYLRNSR